MQDIAQATNVSAMAIYKHFPSKSAILASAIREGIELYDAVLRPEEARGFTSLADLRTLLNSLATIALRRREWGVLWQRELRNLGEVEQHALRGELRTLTARVSSVVAYVRPDLAAQSSDLLAWCVMGALVSVGFHSLSLPRGQYEVVLAIIASRVVEAKVGLASDFVGVQPLASPVSESRRDSLLTHATVLFAERGYAAVGVDDIGDAVGIAGPSVYHHFADKQSILAESIQRGIDGLREKLGLSLGADESPTSTIKRLLRSLIDFAIADRFVVRVVFSELDQLDPAARELAAGQLRKFIDSASQLLGQIVPQERIEARVKVLAVIRVIGEVIQTPHLRAQPGLSGDLFQVALAMLEVPA
jgi:AcrR family transcriptional regulator